MAQQVNFNDVNVFGNIEITRMEDLDEVLAHLRDQNEDEDSKGAGMEHHTSGNDIEQGRGVLSAFQDLSVQDLAAAEDAHSIIANVSKSSDSSMSPEDQAYWRGYAQRDWELKGLDQVREEILDFFKTDFEEDTYRNDNTMQALIPVLRDAVVCGKDKVIKNVHLAMVSGATKEQTLKYMLGKDLPVNKKSRGLGADGKATKTRASSLWSHPLDIREHREHG